VKYEFRFSGLRQYVDQFLEGALLTVELSAMAMVIGLAIGIVCALIATQGPRSARRVVTAYVESIRNTPLLVQCFFIFFGLPSAGLSMTAWQAALVALSVNLGAYATEIVRAGIESIHRGQIEAGIALGLSRLELFRYVIIFPAVKNIYPALTSQFILLLLGSSVVSQISAPELFYTGAYIDSRTFLSFEIYLVITAIYLVLSLGFRMLFKCIDVLAFRR
jgi:polar amino acid transport system permease protein